MKDILEYILLIMLAASIMTFSQITRAEVDYVDVRDSLSKDIKKTVIVIGCTDGSRVLIPVDKNEKNVVKKYKIDITKMCKEN